jgi:hypothetical protein
MPKITKILCVGDNSINTDMQCQTIALQYNVSYKGIVIDQISSDGCYHVSLGDKSISEVEELMYLVDKVIFLDQLATDDLGLQTQILKNICDKDQFNQINLASDDILFIGCSHTHGVGHKTVESVYTSKVSKELNLTPIVRGFPGQGNFKFEDILSEYRLNNGDNVIIQFTDIFRIRFYDPITQMVVHKMGKDFDKIEMGLYTEERLKYEFEQLVYRLVARLRDAKVNFLFFQLASQTSQMLNINLFLSSLKEYCWTPNINLDLADDDLHYGPKSHEKIADRLIKRWKLLYA